VNRAILGSIRGFSLVGRSTKTRFLPFLPFSLHPTSFLPQQALVAQTVNNPGFDTIENLEKI
jgi:hypothetical protein